MSCSLPLPRAPSRTPANASARSAISSKFAKTTCRSFADMSGSPAATRGGEGCDEMRRGREGLRWFFFDVASEERMGEGGLPPRILPRPSPVLITWSAMDAISTKQEHQHSLARQKRQATHPLLSLLRKRYLARPPYHSHNSPPSRQAPRSSSSSSRPSWRSSAESARPASQSPPSPPPSSTVPPPAPAFPARRGKERGRHRGGSQDWEERVRSERSSQGAA